MMIPRPRFFPSAHRAFASCILALAALGSPLAQAHNAWLLPSSTILSRADWITVDGAVSNDLFQFNHASLRLDNLQIDSPDGTPLKPENLHRGKLRSVFDLNLAQRGTYRIAVVNDGLFARWEEDGKRKRWRGSPAEFEQAVPAEADKLMVIEGIGRIETYVTVGKPGLHAATGRGLEYRPVTHPNDWVTEEAAILQFTIDGQPAKGLKVVAIPGNSRYRDSSGEMQAVTDDEGKVSFNWPAAGMYWIYASHRDQQTSHPKAEGRRLSYSGTFEVTH